MNENNPDIPTYLRATELQVEHPGWGWDQAWQAACAELSAAPVVLMNRSLDGPAPYLLPTASLFLDKGQGNQTQMAMLNQTVSAEKPVKSDMDAVALSTSVKNRAMKLRALRPEWSFEQCFKHAQRELATTGVLLNRAGCDESNRAEIAYMRATELQIGNPGVNWDAAWDQAIGELESTPMVLTNRATDAVGLADPYLRAPIEINPDTLRSCRQMKSRVLARLQKDDVLEVVRQAIPMTCHIDGANALYGRIQKRVNDIRNTHRDFTLEQAFEYLEETQPVFFAIAVGSLVNSTDYPW